MTLEPIPLESIQFDNKPQSTYLTPPGSPRSEGKDLERAQSFDSERDPLLLRNKIVDSTALRQRSVPQALFRKNSRLESFYSRQNIQIESLLKPIDTLIQEEGEDENTYRSSIKFAIQVSFIANLCLMVLGLYAAISSGSLAFFSVALDQVFDPFANLVLNYCHRAGEKVDKKKFPSGGSRFETIGEIIYSFVMGAASIVLIAFSIQSLISHSPDTPANTLHIPSVAAVGVAFIVKLSLFLYCFSLKVSILTKLSFLLVFALKGKNTQVRVLWQDHRNDIAVNAFGILTNVGGSSLAWWIDPMGAMIISITLIYLWGSTTVSGLFSLAGKAAPAEFQQLVIYNAMYYSSEIVAVDQVLVYSAGSKFIVEVDIVMHQDTPLSKSHDVSQALQDKLEELKNVERAYVHVDYEVAHRAEHQKSK